MAMTKRTVPVRIDSNLQKTLKSKFPGIPTSDLFNIMYDTSVLKLEASMRKGILYESPQDIIGKKKK